MTGVALLRGARPLLFKAAFRLPPVSFLSGSRCFLSRMAFTTIEKGKPKSLDYKMYFADSKGHHISPFHDIPLFANKDDSVFNMVVEVPRWTNAKMEISKEDHLNPIKQDVKKGDLRFINNCFPYHGYLWNYGAIPQTWEDPDHTDEHTKQKGDNDPLDVCEIGSVVKERGAVIQVKVLGIMALIDEGETDWKVFAIDVTDPMAEKLNDINDVQEHMPGLVEHTTRWFRIYKMPTGKPANQFAFNGEVKNKTFALEVISQAHAHWLKMIMSTDTKAKIARMNTTVEGSKEKVSAEDAAVIVNRPQAPAPHQSTDEVKNKAVEVECWDFVNE